jgi:hypothetical protein
MPNFPWGIFNSNEDLAWMSANPQLDCAALLFSPNAKASQALGKAIKEQLRINQRTTDMSALAEIRKAGVIKVELLPSTTPEIADAKLRNSGSRFAELEIGRKKYGGVFDVLNMGMWLTGENPRNRGGHVVRYKHFYDQDNFFSRDSFQMQNHVLHVGRQPSALLFSLHVHSKDLKLFGRRWDLNLDRRVRAAQSERNAKSFSFRGYLGSAFDIYISVNRNLVVTLGLLLRIDLAIGLIKKVRGKSD